MRGKPRPQVERDRHEGITPAHAGKTHPMWSGCRARGDHPRACGENPIIEEIEDGTEGSPPRMRGKLMFRVPRRARVGITPAHAGKTSTKCFTTSACRDHPRACGENSFQLCKHLQQPGSPPRMRGKQAVKLRDVRHAGITPAHAGKTCSVTPLRCGERDHPRACGENPNPHKC